MAPPWLLLGVNGTEGAEVQAKPALHRVYGRTQSPKGRQIKRKYSPKFWSIKKF